MPRQAAPFTGDISAEMLKDAGASYVILGHSERRAGHNESDKSFATRPRRLSARGWRRSSASAKRERSERRATPSASSARNWRVRFRIIRRPRVIVIAYEPVWAIGTGLTPTPEDIAEMHRLIRDRVEPHLPGQGDSLRILYGGSVQPANAAELMCT